MTGLGETVRKRIGETTLPPSTAPSPRRTYLALPLAQGQEGDMLIISRASQPRPTGILDQIVFVVGAALFTVGYLAASWPLSIRCHWHPPRTSCDNLKMSQDVNVPVGWGWGAAKSPLVENY